MLASASIGTTPWGVPMKVQSAVRSPLITVLLAMCWLVAGARRLSAETQSSCAPSPAVKAALDQLPSYQSARQTDWQYHELQQSAIQALLKQYPDDVFVRRADIRSREHPTADHDKVIAQYKALHEQRPDDPKVDYLYGLTLVVHDLPQAVKL